MSDQDDQRAANSGDIDQNEKVTQGMQGADGNVDSNGLDTDPAKRQEKLEEVVTNLSDTTQSS
ncbi:hypothetical protein [Deinococcus sp.]|uniref:hypothetical protein n=1 Tax=Deinococcus sp. TaxID=47478 RepID=UPI0025C0DDFA|nr:hypothetical protein [Deinococcus sp.]